MSKTLNYGGVDYTFEDGVSDEEALSRTFGECLNITMKINALWEIFVLIMYAITFATYEQTYSCAKPDTASWDYLK